MRWRISTTLFTGGMGEKIYCRRPRLTTRRPSLLLRKVIMVEREFGSRVGSNKCVAVECFKHDVLMIQSSDHHKNLVDQSLCAKEGYLRAWWHPRHGSGDLPSPRFWKFRAWWDVSNFSRNIILWPHEGILLSREDSGGPGYLGCPWLVEQVHCFVE